MILVSAAEADRMRNQGGTRIRELASSALRAGPWSVTEQRPAHPPADCAPNDYYSEGPYWWPDPKNPGGPFVRKDGERYPGRFEENRRALGRMSEAVLALGMGAFLLEDARCAGHAGRILSTWFLDSRTRMNPHLEFGQAIPGRNTGRGAGLIETVGLIHAVQGVALLERSGKLDSAVAGSVRRWFQDFLKWMTTSRKGLSEKQASNNHATWWTAQVAAFAGFTGDQVTRRMAWAHYRDYLLPKQVRADGSCPAEEARTRSLSYSAMNLDGFSVLCRQAQAAGVDLWRYRTKDGIGIERAFTYLLPYVLRPETWKKPQIGPFEPESVYFPGLGGRGLGSAELLEGYRRLPRGRGAWARFIDLAVSL